jgi:N-acetylmuramoyl-L-alanine amidase
MFSYKLNKKKSIIALFSVLYLSVGFANHLAKTPFIIDEEKHVLVSELLPPDSVYRIRKVVIDAGHGGKDSGCLGFSKKQEKDITLKIALAVGKKIKNTYPNIQVIYTRDKDVFIPLDERADIANKARADLFISIHCNYLPGHSSYQGSETYVLGLHKTKENLEVARRENAAVILEDNYQKRYNGYKWDSPEANIIITAWQASYLDRSTRLAAEVEKQLNNTAKRKSHGVKQAGFLVLRETTMPSILIETGFLSNADEERFLNSADGQADEAEAIFKAFSHYKKNIEGGGGRNPMPIVEEARENVTEYMPAPLPEEKERSSPKRVAEATTIEFTAKGGSAIKVKEKPILFKVQLTTAPNKLNTQNDARWNNVGEVEIRNEDKLYKYLAVGFGSYEAAIQGAKDLNAAGFVGAFVVAYEGEERIDVKVAKNKLKGLNIIKNE